jgi:hypothetical protein
MLKHLGGVGLGWCRGGPVGEGRFGFYALLDLAHRMGIVMSSKG